MNDLASKHSNLMTITKIGESYLKNNPGRSNNSFDIPTYGHDIFAIVIIYVISRTYLDYFFI